MRPLRPVFLLHDADWMDSPTSQKKPKLTKASFNDKIIEYEDED